MNTPSVALVILNWNTAFYLERFLPFLLATSYMNKEIYVIDNNSTDGSLEMLRDPLSHGPRPSHDRQQRLCRWL